ncbi:hypothetical protein [Halomicronema sp. CCY15110]|uniref:hypothetical protein n=1 Tax=Halomicronema sp. CCY15110 TaxID=2767773 RepID=UPI00194F0820|nr:hypothetical protein [Halomicronema sp. CCY15110]
MAGHTLTTASTLQCPHGGAVNIVSSNSRVKADGAYTVTLADTFTVSGCPFQIPSTPPIPSPCVRVQWLVPDTRVRVNGSLSLSRSSTSLCLSAAQVPQGSVLVGNTQTRTQSQ